MNEHRELVESRALAEATPVAGRPGRFQIGLITPGWGSSGFYSAEVLEAAAGDRVFPAGTHMYLDHPTETEQYERPARSVKDLAAVLAEDAVWDGKQLVAEATVFGPFREVLGQMKDSIGVSIRAAAEVTEGGEAEGRRGRIVDRLVESASVDFVTHAGRGGRVLQVIESARPAAVVERAIAQGVSEATANDTREALQDALRAAYGGKQSWVWVRDFDATTVWYEHDTATASATYAEAYTLDAAGSVTLAGDRTEVRARTAFVPVNPAGQSTTKESEEDAMTSPTTAGSAPTDPPATSTATEATTPSSEATAATTTGTAPATPATEAAPATPATTTTEPTATRAEENQTMTTSQGAAGPAPVGPRQVMEAQIQQMREENAQLRARERGRAVIGEVLNDAWLTPSTVARLSSELIESLPITNGQLDEQALQQSATAARDRAETELAEALQAAGMGQPRDLGLTEESTNIGNAEQYDQRLSSSLQSLGLSESAAKTAVKGR